MHKNLIITFRKTHYTTKYINIATIYLLLLTVVKQMRDKRKEKCESWTARLMGKLTSVIRDIGAITNVPRKSNLA